MRKHHQYANLFLEVIPLVDDYSKKMMSDDQLTNFVEDSGPVVAGATAVASEPPRRRWGVGRRFLCNKQDLSLELDQVSMILDQLWGLLSVHKVKSNILWYYNQGKGRRIRVAIQ